MTRFIAFFRWTRTEWMSFISHPKVAFYFLSSIQLVFLYTHRYVWYIMILITIFVLCDVVFTINGTLKAFFVLPRSVYWTIVYTMYRYKKKKKVISVKIPAPFITTRRGVSHTKKKWKFTFCDVYFFLRL